MFYQIASSKVWPLSWPSSSFSSQALQVIPALTEICIPEQRDSVGGRGARCQIWPPEFHPWVPLGGRRNSTLGICLLTCTCGLVPIHAYTYKQNKYNFNKKDKSILSFHFQYSPYSGKPWTINSDPQLGWNLCKPGNLALLGNLGHRAGKVSDKTVCPSCPCQWTVNGALNVLPLRVSFGVWLKVSGWTEGELEIRV